MTIEAEIFFISSFWLVLQLGHIYHELFASLVCSLETIIILFFRVMESTFPYLGIYTSKENKTMSIFVFFLWVHFQIT